LKAVYPDYAWQPLRFVESGHTPRGFWADDKNLLKVLEKAAQKLGIKQVKRRIFCLFCLSFPFHYGYLFFNK
jgi:hypothetical protein